MGCRLSNFVIKGQWTREDIDGYKVEVVLAMTKGLS